MPRKCVKESVNPITEMLPDVVENNLAETGTSRGMIYGGKHYTGLEIQPIDLIRSWSTAAEYEGYLRGCILKYLGRYKGKGGVSDLMKASDYLQELINHVGQIDQA